MNIKPKDQFIGWLPMPVDYKTQFGWINIDFPGKFFVFLFLSGNIFFQKISKEIMIGKSISQQIVFDKEPQLQEPGDELILNSIVFHHFLSYRSERFQHFLSP